MQGTLGGSVAHADPAADYPVALTAAGERRNRSNRSAAGTRRIAARDFFRGLFETALTAGRDQSPRSWCLAGPKNLAARPIEKLSLVAGDFAIVSVAAVVSDTAQIAVGGCGPKPLFASGLDLTDAALLEAGRRLAAESDPPNDQRASAAYRRKVMPELVRRAVREALASQ